MDVRSLVDHHHALWRRFADHYVDALTWEELSRDHETSHQTIANVTMHAVNMEDWWLHYVMPGKPWAGPAWDGFKDAKSMRERIHEVEAKTGALLAKMSPEELARPRTFDSEGMKGTASLEQVLAEVLSEATHHRGEVLAMMWRMDKEPPYIGYLEWLAQRR